MHRYLQIFFYLLAVHIPSNNLIFDLRENECFKRSMSMRPNLLWQPYKAILQQQNILKFPYTFISKYLLLKNCITKSLYAKAISRCERNKAEFPNSKVSSKSAAPVQRPFMLAARDCFTSRRVFKSVTRTVYWDGILVRELMTPIFINDRLRAPFFPIIYCFRIK